MREIVARDAAVRARGDGPRRGDRASSRTSGEKYKAELHPRTCRASEDDHALPPGRLGRPVPRPAPALDRRCRQGVQADEGGRRLLARRSPQRACCSASTAPRGATRRSSTPTSISWRRPRSATTAASARRWTCSTSRKRRSAASSGTRRAGRSTAPLEDYMRRRLDAAGYQEVQDAAAARPRAVGDAPATGRSSARTCSSPSVEDEDKTLALKPMNCPCHVQIFSQGLRSYRELPLRLAEFGSCHRYEPSGALHGIMRVRAFTQDDAHIFCTEEQIDAETVALRASCCARSTAISASTTFAVKFADRPPMRAGADAVWDRAEARAASEACATAGRRVHAQPRRGRVLRPEARIRAARRDRPRLAVRHACRSTSCCPSGSTPTTSARTARGSAPVMLHRAILGSLRALHRHPDRALRRPLPALAGAGAGRWSRRSSPTPTSYAARGRRRRCGAAGLRVGARPAQREDQLQGARAQPGACAGAGGRRAAGGGDTAPWRCAGWAARRRRSCRLTRPCAGLRREATPPDLRGWSRPRRPSLEEARLIGRSLLGTLTADRRRRAGLNLATETGDDHSQRTNARSADPRRAPRERGDPSPAGATDRPGRRDAGRDDRPGRAAARLFGRARPGGDQPERRSAGRARSSTSASSNTNSRRRRTRPRRSRRSSRSRRSRSARTSTRTTTR